MQLFSDIWSLFFPKICMSCNDVLHAEEKMICTYCRHKLPLTNYHFGEKNLTEKIFYGRCSVEHATSLLVFKKHGMVQKLIHQLKYKGHEEIGTLLGNWLGSELATLENYKNIDVIVPVPLHKKKLRKRGYNQVDTFGKALAKQLHIPFVTDVLCRIKDSKTQTIKDRVTRWVDIEESFTVKNISILTTKHILLVDDVVTTGAVLESCVLALQKIPSIKVSIATMAITL